MTQMKRHARTRPDSGRVLWVGDDRDWSLMRSGRSALICPQGGCNGPLHPVLSARGTRFLRWGRTGAGGCPHWMVPTGGGGPESDRHLWLKARLASICLGLGWSALPEDPATRADVWLPDSRTVLEVQLRRSDLLQRTHARYQAGAASVVWFVSSDAAVGPALFRSPAVRLAVVDPRDPARQVRPWETGEEARLIVFGTLWRWRDWRLARGAMSAYGFLADLLAGSLGWCPPGTPGLPGGRGGWIRWLDLASAPPAGSLEPAAWVAAELARRSARRAAK